MLGAGWEAATRLLWGLVPQLSPALVTSPDVMSHGSVSNSMRGGLGWRVRAVSVGN